jgi:hypothetical protein
MMQDTLSRMAGTSSGHDGAESGQGFNPELRNEQALAAFAD